MRAHTAHRVRAFAPGSHSEALYPESCSTQQPRGRHLPSRYNSRDESNGLRSAYRSEALASVVAFAAAGWFQQRPATREKETVQRAFLKHCLKRRNRQAYVYNGVESMAENVPAEIVRARRSSERFVSQYPAYRNRKCRECRTCSRFMFVRVLVRHLVPTAYSRFIVLTHGEHV